MGTHASADTVQGQTLAQLHTSDSAGAAACSAASSKAICLLLNARSMLQTAAGQDG